jgi:hypothetical protein
MPDRIAYTIVIERPEVGDTVLLISKDRATVSRVNVVRRRSSAGVLCGTLSSFTVSPGFLSYYPRFV